MPVFIISFDPLHIALYLIGIEGYSNELLSSSPAISALRFGTSWQNDAVGYFLFVGYPSFFRFEIIFNYSGVAFSELS